MSKKLHIAARMHDIQPFHVMALLGRARELEAQGRDIVHMEIGEPDFITAQPIIDAGVKALQAGQTHYTPSLGLPALREAISAFYKQRYNQDVPARRIVITPGASGALQLIFSALINPGDSVVMADPGYPCNRHFVRLNEGETIGVPVNADSDYQLTADLLKQYWATNTVAAMLASPSNPTGTIVNEASLQAMHAVSQARGGNLIVDEIYHGLVYDQDISTALKISADDVFVINSFSKYFGMTGWRVGWLVAPEGYIDAIDRLAQNVFLAASTPAQYAALAAFQPETMEILEQRRAAFAERRDYLLPALRELGFDIPVTPQGAFYLYANCSRFTDDSYRFAGRLLEEAGVAITPGIDFGSHRPEQHVRFAYTTSLEYLQKGVERIKRFLGE
ncbi:pyridoxal phosphate-dependent aminotransferase [Sulfuriflexus mobilis]|uniref:pyridoxal phosphate-dependent aminotransferase n=1 Tax=Sulfuriflexus mobilis TaxID=1811807 RepID=UPI000F84C418|nr:pyridoxal phosphate-dependent aminotransferase [Sulfuriflexus mobilis]